MTSSSCKEQGHFPVASCSSSRFLCTFRSPFPIHVFPFLMDGSKKSTSHVYMSDGHGSLHLDPSDEKSTMT